MEDIQTRKSTGLLSKTMSLTTRKLKLSALKTSKTKPDDDEDYVSDEDSPLAHELLKLKSNAFMWKSAYARNNHLIICPQKVVTFVEEEPPNS